MVCREYRQENMGARSTQGEPSMYRRLYSSILEGTLGMNVFSKSSEPKQLNWEASCLPPCLNPLQKGTVKLKAVLLLEFQSVHSQVPRLELPDFNYALNSPLLCYVEALAGTNMSIVHRIIRSTSCSNHIYEGRLPALLLKPEISRSK